MMTKVQRNWKIPTPPPENFSLSLVPGSSPRAKNAPPAKPLENITVNAANLRKRDLYKMRDLSAGVLKDHRVCICGKRLLKNETDVNVIKNIHDKIHFSNLMKCGSIWVCPVCNYKIGTVRRIEIEGIITNARTEGKEIYHQTFTIRHHKGQSLKSLLKLMQDEWRKIGKARLYKEFFKTVKYVRAMEITHGKNGFHPHYHFLFICDKLDREKLNDLISQWCKQTGATSENCVLKQCNSKQDIEEYITKFEIKHEMTNSQNKTSGSTFWGLLEDPEKNKDLIQEYAEATKKQRSFTCSKGLRIKTDEEIIEMSDKAVKILIEINRTVYFDVIVKYQLYRVILDNAESLERIDELLHLYKVQRQGTKLLPANYLYSDCFPQTNVFQGKAARIF